MSDFDSNEKKEGYSFDDFLEDEIKDSAFKVSIYPHRAVPHLIILAVPVVFYVMFRPFILLLKESGMSDLAVTFEAVLFFVLMIGIFLTVYNCGREVVVSGHGIVVRKFFVVNESFSVSDVTECQVITGLVTGGRLHEHYSKAVIRYGDGHSFAIEDNLFRNWDKLVRYMEMNKKVIYTDGRGAISRKIDDMLRK